MKTCWTPLSPTPIVATVWPSLQGSDSFGHYNNFANAAHMLCRLGWAWECHGFRSEHQQLRRKTTSFSCFGKERRCSFFGSIHVVTGSWPLQKMANLETFNVEGSHHRQDDDSSFVQRAQTQTTSFVLASHDAAGRGSSYVYVPSKGVSSRVKIIVNTVLSGNQTQQFRILYR